MESNDYKTQEDTLDTTFDELLKTCNFSDIIDNEGLNRLVLKSSDILEVGT